MALVPSWAKGISTGNRMINARAETQAEKSSFKRWLKKHRCLVVADGFYEWRKNAKGKVPMLFKLKSGALFVFAGLWDVWTKPDGQTLRTYNIVTTEPNDLAVSVHNRMPVMLNDSNALDWLKGDEIEHALSLLKPFSADLMDGYEVSKLLNSPSNDRPEGIAPINE